MNARKKATLLLVSAIFMLFQLGCGLESIIGATPTNPHVYGDGTDEAPIATLAPLTTQAPQARQAPLATLAQSTGGTILFQEPFDSNAAGWETGRRSDSDGDLSRLVVDGKYRIAMASKTDYFYVVSSIPNSTSKDFLLSVEATITDTTATPGDFELGFTVREANGVDGKRYEFLFSNDNGYTVNLWPSNNSQNVQELLSGNLATARLDKGVTNTFAIEAIGSTFTFFVNGDKVDSFTDSPINQAGSMSLWVGLDKANQSATVDFDNLSIKSIP
jgi:hypothetical protein